jgi:hypothetical protein
VEISTKKKQFFEQEFDVQIEIPKDMDISQSTLVRLPDGTIVNMEAVDKFNPAQLEKYFLANKKLLLQKFMN